MSENIWELDTERIVIPEATKVWEQRLIQWNNGLDYWRTVSLPYKVKIHFEPGQVKAVDFSFNLSLTSKMGFKIDYKDMDCDVKFSFAQAHARFIRGQENPRPNPGTSWDAQFIDTQIDVETDEYDYAAFNYDGVVIQAYNYWPYSASLDAECDTMFIRLDDIDAYGDVILSIFPYNNFINGRFESEVIDLSTFDFDSDSFRYHLSPGELAHFIINKDTTNTNNLTFEFENLQVPSTGDWHLCMGDTAGLNNYYVVDVPKFIPRSDTGNKEQIFTVDIREIMYSRTISATYEELYFWIAPQDHTYPYVTPTNLDTADGYDRVPECSCDIILSHNHKPPKATLVTLHYMRDNNTEMTTLQHKFTLGDMTRDITVDSPFYYTDPGGRNRYVFKSFKWNERDVITTSRTYTLTDEVANAHAVFDAKSQWNLVDIYAYYEVNNETWITEWSFGQKIQFGVIEPAGEGPGLLYGIYMQPGKVYCVQMKFNYSGNSNIYIRKDTLVYCTLSNEYSENVNPQTGDVDVYKLKRTLGETFTYDFEAGKTYYLYINLPSLSSAAAQLEIATYAAKTNTDKQVIFYKSIPGNRKSSSFPKWLKYGTIVNPADYASEFPGTYDHAEDEAGNVITQIEIKGDTNIYLCYLGSTAYNLTLYKGNAQSVSITVDGVTSTTTNASITKSILGNKKVTVTYNPKKTDNGYYKFYGFYTQSNGSGVCYGTEYSSTFAMPAASISLWPCSGKVSGRFAWTYAKTAGIEPNLTAAEWNALWDCIQGHLGVSYPHTAAYVGNALTAGMYNEAVSAIGAGSNVVSGQPLSAALLNELVTNVNNM